MNIKPDQAHGLVPIEQHNCLTAGPAPWTATRIAEDMFHVARSVFGSGSYEDDQRVYRTLQAYEWQRTNTSSPHGEYIASRARTKTDMSEWQPISTAPTDGRTILLGRYNELGNWRTMRGKWMNQDCIDETREDPESGEPGWFETCVENDDLPNCWSTNPTHWMPLPGAPEATSATPPGWVLVPVEPTAAMIDAPDMTLSGRAGVYRAMLAAAPKVPT